MLQELFQALYYLISLILIFSVYKLLCRLLLSRHVFGWQMQLSFGPRAMKAFTCQVRLDFFARISQRWALCHFLSRAMRAKLAQNDISLDHAMFKKLRGRKGNVRLKSDFIDQSVSPGKTWNSNFSIAARINKTCLVWMFVGDTPLLCQQQKLAAKPESITPCKLTTHANSPEPIPGIENLILWSRLPYLLQHNQGIISAHVRLFSSGIRGGDLFIESCLRLLLQGAKDSVI